MKTDFDLGSCILESVILTCLRLCAQTVHIMRTFGYSGQSKIEKAQVKNKRQEDFGERLTHTFAVIYPWLGVQPGGTSENARALGQWDMGQTSFESFES